MKNRNNSSKCHTNYFLRSGQSFFRMFFRFIEKWGSFWDFKAHGYQGKEDKRD